MDRDTLEEYLEEAKDILLSDFYLYFLIVANFLVPAVVFIDSIFANLVLVFWVIAVFTIHAERKRIAEETSWTPSAWYYSGAIPGPFGIIVLLYFFTKRWLAKKAEERKEEDDYDELEFEPKTGV